ncbi:MAG: phage head closure protein [Gammaproteobacteria bacterium]|nr:phage head closure protein [Gammaproteobacteria bacterium]
MSNIGRMRHRLTLQRNTPTNSDSGTQIPVWSAETTLWANLQGPTVKSRFNQEQRKQVTEYKVVCRSNSLITKGKRFLTLGGTVMVIDRVNNEDQLGKFMQIVCIEEVANNAP